MKRSTPSERASAHHASVQLAREWWGRASIPRLTPSLLDLVASEMMSEDIAGLLRAIVERRIPLSVVSRDASAGKTTLLTALLAHLPPEINRLHLRGCHEPFDFVWDPSKVPTETALLINEISPHWPFYLWGPMVAKTLRLSRRGYSHYATAHAASAAELLALLANKPLNVPPRDIAALGVIVVLEARPVGAGSEPGGPVRRITSCHGLTLAPDERGVVLSELAGVDTEGGEARLRPGDLVAWSAHPRPELPDLGPIVAMRVASLARDVAQHSVPGCGKE